MGVGSYQPLARNFGVRCEAESEGSWRQSSEPRNTNHIRHFQQVEFAQKNSKTLHEIDMGSGTDNYTIYHAAKDLDVTGIDISESAIAIAKKKATIKCSL